MQTVDDIRRIVDEYFDACETEVRRIFKGDVRGYCMSAEGLHRFITEIEDKDASIVDCGGGCSTWVLRRLFNNVTTVEPHVEYASLLRLKLRVNGIYEHGFVSDLMDAPESDYVLYDLDKTYAGRADYLEPAFHKTRRLIYIDDADDRMHMADYRSAVIQFATGHGLDYEDCPEAKDKYGRWGVIIRRHDGTYRPEPTERDAED